MLKHKLNEGLSRSALDHLIQPLLSVDEYSSKISDKRAIVVGFFVNDQDPASDLSNFIDRSNIQILDTEVSPAPTPDGYYMVFVELQRDDDFPKSVVDMLEEVNNLTNVKEWTFQCPQHDEPLPATLGNLKKYVELSQDNILDDTTENKVSESREFWQHADADTIEIKENIITFVKYNAPYRYVILNESPSGPLNFEFESSVRGLQSLLGPAYNVWAIGKKLVVEHYDDCVVLQDLS